MSKNQPGSFNEPCILQCGPAGLDSWNPRLAQKQLVVAIGQLKYPFTIFYILLLYYDMSLWGNIHFFRLLWLSRSDSWPSIPLAHQRATQAIAGAWWARGTATTGPTAASTQSAPATRTTGPRRPPAIACCCAAWPGGAPLGADVRPPRSLQVCPTNEFHSPDQ